MQYTYIDGMLMRSCNMVELEVMKSVIKHLMADISGPVMAKLGQITVAG